MYIYIYIHIHCMCILVTVTHINYYVYTHTVYTYIYIYIYYTCYRIIYYVRLVSNSVTTVVLMLGAVERLSHNAGIICCDTWCVSIWCVLVCVANVWRGTWWRTITQFHTSQTLCRGRLCLHTMWRVGDNPVSVFDKPVQPNTLRCPSTCTWLHLCLYAMHPALYLAPLT